MNAAKDTSGRPAGRPATAAYAGIASVLVGAGIVLVAHTTHGTADPRPAAAASSTARGIAGAPGGDPSTSSAQLPAASSAPVAAPTPAATTETTATTETVEPTAAPAPSPVTTARTTTAAPRRPATPAAKPAPPGCGQWVYKKSTGTFIRIPAPC